MRAFRVRLAALALIALGGAGSALGADVPAPTGLVALHGVEPGLWQVDAPGEPEHKVCVSNPAALLQLHHGGLSCSRLVIANGERVATVHYSCPGAGWGRTTIRVDTPHAARIDTQGIMDNAPFAWSGVGHRVGACGGAEPGLLARASLGGR